MNIKVKEIFKISSEKERKKSFLIYRIMRLYSDLNTLNVIFLEEIEELVMVDEKFKKSLLNRFINRKNDTIYLTDFIFIMKNIKYKSFNNHNTRLMYYLRVYTIHINEGIKLFKKIKEKYNDVYIELFDMNSDILKYKKILEKEYEYSNEKTVSNNFIKKLRDEGVHYYIFEDNDFENFENTVKEIIKSQKKDIKIKYNTLDELIHIISFATPVLGFKIEKLKAFFKFVFLVYSINKVSHTVLKKYYEQNNLTSMMEELETNSVIRSIKIYFAID